MDLFIFRHGQAGHFGDPDWPDDSKRPLTENGRRRFALMVDKLVEREFSTAVIATSPLMRCVQTAQIISDGLSNNPQVVALDELLPGSDLDALLKWSIRQTEKYRQVTWVGHSPDVGRMASTLTGNTQGCIRFAKGAVASIRFHGTPEIGHGELRWLMTAKMLGC